MIILLTNDDGIDAPGLRTLVSRLSGYEPFVVAPSGHRSSCGHSLGLYSDIEVARRGPREWAVSGTPTDCVKLALLEILGERPGLVVSGINPGPNMANNIHYSGTVAAASEAAFWGIPSIAVSIGAAEPSHLSTAADLIADIVDRGGWKHIPEGSLLNVNVPDLPAASLAGQAWTRTARFSDDVPFTVVEPDRLYRYTRWSGQDVHGMQGTDVEALSLGFVSLTLLGTDRTLSPAGLQDILER